MTRGVPLIAAAVVVALVLVPSGYASHLSMDMPGLGGAAVPPASLALLATTAIAALLQVLWLLAGPQLGLRSPRARDAVWVLALLPLAVSAARAHALSPSSAVPTGDALSERIAEVGRVSGEHMWALLSTLALTVGFGAARTLELAAAWRERVPRERAGFARAGAALLLTGPLVGLILATSTGVDWISSWIRWAGCGLAAIVCAGSALVPGRGEARVLGGTTFVLAVVLGLLAEREYVEALGHDALAHRDPFDPAVGWVRGLAQIAAAVEPRERYGLLVALWPWLALAPGTSWRQASPPLASGLLLVALGAVLAMTISSRLDHGALLAAGGAPAALDEPNEIRWSERALPRTAPFLRALRHPPELTPPEPEGSPVHCAAWTAPAPSDG